MKKKKKEPESDPCMVGNITIVCAKCGAIYFGPDVTLCKQCGFAWGSLEAPEKPIEPKEFNHQPELF